jgi:hypothetical protein
MLSLHRSWQASTTTINLSPNSACMPRTTSSEGYTSPVLVPMTTCSTATEEEEESGPVSFSRRVPQSLSSWSVTEPSALRALNSITSMSPA